jgi:hypothetical protein
MQASLKASVAAAVVSLLVVCATAARADDVPRPPYGRIIPPGPAVPRECAQFSGVWAGSWSRVRESFNIWVAQIAPDCKVRVIYAWDSSMGKGKEGFSPRPIDGMIVNGVLSFARHPRSKGELTARIELRSGASGITATGVAPQRGADHSVGPLQRLAL